MTDMQKECKHEWKTVKKYVTPDYDNKKRGKLIDGHIKLGGGEFTGKRQTFVFRSCIKCRFYQAQDLEAV